MTRHWIRYSLYACLPVALAAALLFVLLPRGATSQTGPGPSGLLADIVLPTGVFIPDSIEGNPLLGEISCPDGSILSTSRGHWEYPDPHSDSGWRPTNYYSGVTATSWNGLYLGGRLVEYPYPNPGVDYPSSWHWVSVITGTPLRAGRYAVSFNWSCHPADRAGPWIRAEGKELVVIEVTGDDFLHPDGMSHYIGHVHSLPPAARWADTHAEHANTCRNLGGFYDTEWDRGATPRSDPHGHCCIPAEADANYRTASGCQNSKLPPASANDDSGGGDSRGDDSEGDEPASDD